MKFDVLVIGSGASGLAAAVSAERAGATRRARDQGLDPVLQLGQGAGRDPGRVRRGRLARDPRRRRLEELARDRGQGAGHGPDERGAGRDPLARGARRRVHARERRLPARELRRRESQAPAPGRRPHRPRDHEGACARRSRRAGAPRCPKSPLSDLERTESGWRARCGEHERRGRRRRPRCRRPLLPGRRGARRALDQPPGRDRRGDADRGRPRRRATRFRRAPVPPQRRRLARDDAGLLDPGDDARLRSRAPECRPRGVHRLARAARRGQPGDLRRGREGQGRRDPRRAPCRLPRHHADRRGGRRDLAALHAPPLPRRRHRPARRADPHLPRPALPERRARDRRSRRDDRSKASTLAARSRAGPTAATG